ncbi:hypothetical protein FQZ97_431630 [compost metagenome]
MATSLLIMSVAAFVSLGASVDSIFNRNNGPVFDTRKFIRQSERPKLIPSALSSLNFAQRNDLARSG